MTYEKIQMLATLALVAYAAYAIWQGLRRPAGMRLTSDVPTNTLVRIDLGGETSAGWRHRSGNWTVIRQWHGYPTTMSATDADVRGWYPLF